MKAKYSLAIFDLDGTILDTLDDLCDSLNFALSSVGLPERSRDEVRSFLGNGIRKLVERATPSSDEAKKESVFSLFRERYKLHCYDKTRAYDGITELIRALSGRGISCAVISNKDDYAVKILCEKFFKDLFEVSVGAREGIRKKPYPDAVETIISMLGKRKEDCVYIGDSEVDVETAKNAGIDCIAVSWGFRSKEELTLAGAEKIADDASRLFGMITEQY